jgi:hypothetical protein
LLARPPDGDSGAEFSRKSPVSLDKDQVQHIAVLARLKLADNEFGETVDKLSKIVPKVIE